LPGGKEICPDRLADAEGYVAANHLNRCHDGTFRMQHFSQGKGPEADSAMNACHRS